MSDRTDDLKFRLTKIKNLFRHHLKNIIVVLTKCERFNPDDKCAMAFVLEHEMGLPNVFFKDENTEPMRLAHWINSFVEEMDTVNMGDGIFETQTLNALISDVEQDSQIIDLRNSKEKMFREIYDSTLKTFEASDDKELKRALYFSLKQQMNRITDEYANEVAPLYKDKWQLSAELIIFQNSILSLFSSFKQMVMRSIKIDNVVYNGDTTARYKRCPCGLIWFRVYGCDSITCGRRSVSGDYSNNKFYNFSITWTGSKLEIKQIVTEPTNIRYTETDLIGLSEKEKILNADIGKTGKVLISPIGCGKNSKWKEMEDVTDLVLLELKDVEIGLVSETDSIIKKHEGKVKAITGDDAVEIISKKIFTKYSVGQMSKWLKSNDLGKLVETFIDEDIDGLALLELSEADLISMNISIGLRKKLMLTLKNIV